MKSSSLFAWLMVAAGIAVAISGCVASGPAPLAQSQPPLPTASPAAHLLYVDHYGIFYEYALPLTSASKPVRTLTEWPGLVSPPVIAADQYGNVALGSPTQLRFFHVPITSFAASHAYLTLTLTPAMTGIGGSGQADLVDMEYDPNENLWLLNDLNSEVSELASPITKSTVSAALTIGFGAPGSKTAGYTDLIEARFDVNAALYVYAATSLPAYALFKISFPYAKPPSNVGLNVSTPDFVDSSQWPPTAPVAPSLLVGQYDGSLRSPSPGQPPSPPADVMAQFPQPLNPQIGPYPNAWVNTLTTALIADPYRYSFYALSLTDGSLNVYPLPLRGGATPSVSLPCLGGPSHCSQKEEHIFLAP